MAICEYKSPKVDSIDELIYARQQITSMDMFTQGGVFPCDLIEIFHGVEHLVKNEQIFEKSFEKSLRKN
jgi:hypothetical protein